MVTREEHDLYQQVRSRIQATRKMIAESTDIPDYTLWQILARYDTACGGKAWRYRVMAWMFPGKWKPSDEVSGNDLSPEEVHLMARWSDPARHRDFDREIKAVLAMIGHTQDYPLATEITQPVAPPELFKNGVSADEQKAVFREHLGIHKYKMTCGHLNDDYTALGHPFCSVCLRRSSEEQGLWEKSMKIAVELDF